MADLRLSQPRAEEGRGAREGGFMAGSFERLGCDLESLIHVRDEEYSDLTVIAGGRRVAVHRCILAARCSGLRKVLTEIERNANSKLELELDSVVENGRIGYEAFMAVMGYVYGGKFEPWPVVVPCHDPSCSHMTCRPAIDYVLEVICAASLFTLPVLKAVAEVWSSFACVFAPIHILKN